MEQKTYYIRVKSLENKILHFKHIGDLEVEHGFVKFKDLVSKIVYRFPRENVEIQEKEGDHDHTRN